MEYIWSFMQKTKTPVIKRRGFWRTPYIGFVESSVRRTFTVNRYQADLLRQWTSSTHPFEGPAAMLVRLLLGEVSFMQLETGKQSVEYISSGVMWKPSDPYNKEHAPTFVQIPCTTHGKFICDECLR